MYDNGVKEKSFRHMEVCGDVRLKTTAVSKTTAAQARDIDEWI